MTSARSTDTELLCYGCHHYFDKNDVRDRYRDLTVQDSIWELCDESPCPNRNTKVPGISLDADWSEEIDISQIRRITRHNATAAARPSPLNPLPIPSVPAPTMFTEIFKAFSDVPSLKSDGSNYVIWGDRVTMTVEGCGIGAYLTVAAPADKEKERNALRAAIMGKIPDSLFLVLRKQKEPHEIMGALKARFGRATAITDANSLKRLYTLKCEDERKVQTHLDDLISLRDKLAELDISVSDHDFACTIISSIPAAYKPTVAVYKNSIHINNVGKAAAQQKKVDPSELINLLREEAQSRCRTRNVLR